MSSRLDRTAQRYEASRAILVSLVAATLALVLVGVLLSLATIRQQQAATLKAQAQIAEVQQQNRDLLAAQQARDARSQQTADDAIRRLLREQQSQLDEMDARNLARFRAVLDALRASPARAVPRLAPTPSRQPIPCYTRGRSGRCR